MAGRGKRATRTATASPWGPLRRRAYRALWTAQLASNIGTWMQVVGAQWLMVELTNNALQVALVQTALTLPIFLFALPAGAVGDALDRRRVMIVTQSLMLASSATLAVLTIAGVTSPSLLLALTFLLGAGQAFNLPCWQALQLELVGREHLAQAVTLNGVSMNAARAIGPAIGGALVAVAGPEAVFGLNAISFVGMLIALALWRRQVQERPLGAEQMRAAIRAGARFARSSIRLRAVMGRTLLFICFASVIWALLPVVARDRFELESGGYGVLLASLGVGAVIGGAALPLLRQRLSINLLVAAAGAVFALACLALALLETAGPAIPVLVVAGAAWIAALATLNASAQTILPGWVRSRGMALYLLTLQGGNAAGAFAWGLLAQTAGTRVALAGAAGGLVLALPATLRLRLQPLGELDLSPVASPEPELAFEPDAGAGPVLVTVRYRVPERNWDAFREAMRKVARSRRRTGAARWSLYQDGTDRESFLETFVLPTWEEHIRQRLERGTEVDRQLRDRARSLQSDDHEPEVEYLFSAYGE